LEDFLILHTTFLKKVCSITKSQTLFLALLLILPLGVSASPCVSFDGTCLSPSSNVSYSDIQKNLLNLLYESLKPSFDLSPEKMGQISELFVEEMDQALSGKKNTLKMINN